MLWDGQVLPADNRRSCTERGGTFAGDAIPPVLRRRTLYAMLAFYLAGIVYGTLAPFQIDPDAVWQWNLPWHRFIPGDTAANVLLYIPLGVLMRLIVRRRGSADGRDAVISLALLVGLSYLFEACQTVLLHRVGTWTDVFCNGAGAAIGIGLAVVVQRDFRRRHASFYMVLRQRPYRAAAVFITACVTMAALMPFDFHPSPRRIHAAVAHFTSAPLTLPWTTPGDPTRVLSPRQLYDKMLSGAAFGLIAFSLVLSARESGRSREEAVRYALMRTLLLAAAIEALQALTISHVADPRDLLVAWACAGLGSAVASCRLARRDDRLDSPVDTVSGMALLLIAALAVRLVLSSMSMKGHPWPDMPSLWPMAAFFGYSWDQLMVLYGGHLLQYGAMSILAALWYRARHRRPSSVTIVGTALALAALSMIVASLAGRPLDTAQPLLALAGGAMAVQFDRALFDRYRARRSLPIAKGA